jgi:hypothetical protein
MSPAVWLPKGTAFKGIMLVFSSAVNKKILATVALLFRQTLYVLYSSDFICTWRVSVVKQTVLTNGFRGIPQPLYENTALVL